MIADGGRIGVYRGTILGVPLVSLYCGQVQKGHKFFDDDAALACASC